MGGSMKEVLYVWIPVALLMAIRVVPHEDYVLQEVLTTCDGGVREMRW
jgi:hypothetical protein